MAGFYSVPSAGAANYGARALSLAGAERGRGDQYLLARLQNLRNRRAALQETLGRIKQERLAKQQANLAERRSDTANYVALGATVAGAGLGAAGAAGAAGGLTAGQGALVGAGLGSSIGGAAGRAIGGAPVGQEFAQVARMAPVYMEVFDEWTGAKSPGYGRAPGDEGGSSRDVDESASPAWYGRDSDAYLDVLQNIGQSDAEVAALVEQLQNEGFGPGDFEAGENDPW